MTVGTKETSAMAAQVGPRKKMYKNCDRCRQAKRACSAQYVSIAEALANKVACDLCKKKGQVCTFNSLINSFGGIPLGGASGAAYAEILQEAAATSPKSNAIGTVHEAGPSSTMLVKRSRSQRPSQSQSQSYSSSISNDSTNLEEQHDSKRRKQSASDSSSIYTLSSSNRMVISGTRSSFSDSQSAFTSQGRPSIFDFPGLDIWGSSPNVRLSQDADRQHLSSDLIHIYEGVAEHAFSIWVTDATTPYLGDPASMSPASAVMSLHKKVVLLDHVSKRIFKPGPASRSTERRVSEAYHAVLLAYAAQWPRHRSSETAGSGEWRPDEARVRLSLWKQARDKLMDAADAWSFRIVFALMLFAWTGKPPEVPGEEAWAAGDPGSDLPETYVDEPSLDENSALDSSSWQVSAESSTMMSTTALRKLKAFRLKIQHLHRKGIDFWSDAAPGLDTWQVAHRRAEATLLENTYHNLFWYGCMMDTELSVLRKQDAIIGDEDTDLTDQLLSPHHASRMRKLTGSPASGMRKGTPFRKIWDEVIPASSQNHRHLYATSWPCSEETARRTLAYATPIKVLLFRHVGRLQSTYWRQAPAEQVERQIAHALSVVRHWDETYGSFFASCIAHHTELPPSLQSWYTLLAAKCDLAQIYLVEIVKDMDRSAADPFVNTEEVFSALRHKVCVQTSELINAIRSSPRPSSRGQVPQNSAFDYIESTDSTILHSDPWPEMSVHGFACVAKADMKEFAKLAEEGRWNEVQAAEQRVQNCIWALEQLRNRSIMAVGAADEIKRLLEFHSPFRRKQLEKNPLHRQEQERQQQQDNPEIAIEAYLAGVSQQVAQQPAMMPDDLWQNYLQVLSADPGRESSSTTINALASTLAPQQPFVQPLPPPPGDSPMLWSNSGTTTASTIGSVGSAGDFFPPPNTGTMTGKSRTSTEVPSSQMSSSAQVAPIFAPLSYSLPVAGQPTASSPAYMDQVDQSRRRF